MGSIPIKEYRDFWDIPRIFLVEKNDSLLLFDCRFNEKEEDYEKNYQIYLMPNLTKEEVLGSWSQLSEKAIKHLGEVSIEKVKFDETRRRFLDDSVISNELSP